MTNAFQRFCKSFSYRSSGQFVIEGQPMTRVPECRTFGTRVRHGLIAALAGDYQVIINTSLSLSGAIHLKPGAMVCGVSLNTKAIQ